ncbi:type II toxin-antitoxin system YafQ family toxin [uncultured Helicobacter sp.]|uniref:type II toxin-antitoxin system YafQ family toxin n=1 Tax=uncultured Helicobacter sp. TaxID=175537 RepID=UPI00374FA403
MEARKYKVDFSKKFKKEYKKALKQGYANKVDSIIEKLANDEALESKHRDHALKGEYLGYRECHIEPDLLLIYKKQEDILVLVCFRLGSHSELF